MVGFAEVFHFCARNSNHANHNPNFSALIVENATIEPPQHMHTHISVKIPQAFAEPTRLRTPFSFNALSFPNFNSQHVIEMNSFYKNPSAFQPFQSTD